MNGQTPLPYMQRTRGYYAALGFATPYRWAQFEQVPFSPLSVPLSIARVAIVTTAAPYQPKAGPQGPGAAYNGSAKFYQVYAQAIDPAPDLRISHVAIDRQHTTATDQNSYFPLQALKRLQQQRELGELAEKFYGLPTNRSHRQSTTVDCPQLLAKCQADQIDAAVLVPNCPICHQSVAFAARTLESAGIATVILGCAKDVVEHVGVPRFLFNDFPLGNSAGPPHDHETQLAIAQAGLSLLESATEARTTLQTAHRWPGDADWKRHYSNPALLSDAQLLALRADFDREKNAAKNKR